MKERGAAPASDTNNTPLSTVRLRRRGPVSSTPTWTWFERVRARVGGAGLADQISKARILDNASRSPI